MLFTLAVLGVVALLWRSQAETSDPVDDRRLAWVTTARQNGVVGYRDPVGAVSPNGTLVAYTEGRHVRVVPIGGGAPVTVAAAEGQVRHLAWRDESRLVFEDTGAGTRWWTASVGGLAALQPVWPGNKVSAKTAYDPGKAVTLAWSVEDQLRQLAYSSDGKSLAAIALGSERQVWHMAADGEEGQIVRTDVDGTPSSLAWMPSGDLGCLVTVRGRTRVAAPCGGELLVPAPDVDAVGPIAFSPDGVTVYFASPNPGGMVDLWAMTLANRQARRLTGFSRDTYAPSVAADGTVLFKTQSYRTFVADIAGGVTRQLTTFQAETPSWHPTLPLVAVTYGTWRRVVDDAKYPDIAQEIGVVDAGDVAPSSSPREVIAQSDSEDQAMTWSPNGKWIALHSHREMSDDVWLRPADGSQPDRRITFLGRGAEVGWPRWSPDGGTILLDGASPKTGRSSLFVIGVDQESGQVTGDMREVGTPGFDGEITHGEWLPDSRTIVAIAKQAPGRHVILALAAAGGEPRIVHRFDTEHDFPGLGMSPDGRWIAFVAPASDGFFQVFRIPASGGTPEQVTRDPSHKTQPSYAPRGDRIAYTVWSYEAQFWTLRP